MSTFDAVKPLNILALSSWYPSDADPFLGNFVKRHCDAISTTHNVWVIFVAAVDQKSEERIERTQSGNLTEILIYQRSIGNTPLKFVRKRQAILHRCKEIGVNFDIIHAHVLFPLAPLFSSLSKKLRIPWVFTDHWSGFHEAFRPKVNPLKWNWIMDAGKTAKMGFPVSENLASSVQKVFPKMELRCVPNVVEDVFFQSFKNRTPTKIVHFLHVSTLVEEYKNMHGTLKAFSILKRAGYDFHFVVVSDGDFSKTKEWIRELDLGDRVELKGPLLSDQIAIEMAISDALVLFSNTENQPCVVLEALSTGLPVIASSVGDIPSLVSENKGLLAPPRDVEALSQNLIKFIETRSDFSREEVSAGTKESFSKEAIAQKYTDAYADVLGRD